MADTTFGQDGSHYDDTLGARDGLDWYTHKLGDGDHYYADPEYGPHMDAARALGIPILGAYHVLHGGRSVASQAAWLVELADARTPWWRNHPYWCWQIDAEPFDYLTRPSVEECNAFGRELVARTGRRVLGYLPAWSYGADVVQLAFPWWQSSYVAGAGPYRSLYPGNDSPRWIGGGRRADLLQYTSSAIIAGQSTCDANAYVGTLDELKAFLWPGTLPVLIPQPRGTTMHFLHVSNGGQYVADDAFERVWAFTKDGTWPKVRAAAGNPEPVLVDDADIAAGLYGRYMGVWAAPREPASTAAGPHTHDVAGATGPAQPTP